MIAITGFVWAPLGLSAGLCVFLATVGGMVAVRHVVFGTFAALQASLFVIFSLIN